MTTGFRLAGCASGVSPSADRLLLRSAAAQAIGVCFALSAVFGVSGCDRSAPADRAMESNAPHESGPETDSPRDAARLDFGDLESVEPADKQIVQFARFSNVARDSGINFIYDNGSSPQVLMVESTGGGCGWLDYDGDGLADLYLVQGGDPTLPPSDAQPGNCLYRNVNGAKFSDVTGSSGTDDRHYGQGVAIGDFDNDGFDDIYVTNVGPDVLYQNQGDGTFRVIDATNDDETPSWSTSAAWGDLDLDGDLDLYVASYAAYDPKNPKPCFRKSGQRGMCHPKEVDPVPDRCYVNNGDGSFRNVAREWGLYGDGNRGLGVAIVDFNKDGWPDIYVANDTTENFLFLNQRGAGFLDQAKLLGCAVNSNGSPQASMGIAVGDYDGNGYMDLYISHFHNEWNTLYQNLGEFGFHDVTATSQLAAPTMNKLGFGTAMADFDQNGKQELIVVNGHIDDVRDDGLDYEMTPQYFSFNGQTWDDCSLLAGEIFQRKMIGRGLATSDYDNDGDLDLSIVPQNSESILLRNDSGGKHWLKLRLTSQNSNRRGIGSLVTLQCGNRNVVQELAGGTGYCSSNQPVLIFGLGDSSGPYNVNIRWPSGLTQEIENVVPNQLLSVQEPPKAKLVSHE